MNPYSYAIEGLGGMPQSYSEKHPLVEAFTTIESYAPNIHSDTILKRAIETVDKGLREERYSDRTKVFVQTRGWHRLAELIFKDDHYVNTDPTSLSLFLKYAAKVAAMSPADDIRPTDGIHGTNIIEKVTAATSTLCSAIKQRDTVTSEEEEFIQHLAEFFTAYIKSFDNGFAVDRTIVNASVGALTSQRHHAHTKAFLPAFEIVSKKPESAAYAAVNILLNEITRIANHAYNKFKVLNSDDHPYFPQEWMKPVTDEINEPRFSASIKAHRFEFCQEQASFGKALDVSIMYNDAQRELYKSQGTFNVLLHSIKATKLAAFDKNGLSDPYVAFGQFDKPSYKTKTMKKNLNPEWNLQNENATFTVSHYFSVVDVTLMDWDLIGKNEKMCDFAIDFGALRAMFVSETQSPNDIFTLVLKSPSSVKKGDNYVTGMHGELTLVFSFIEFIPPK